MQKQTGAIMLIASTCIGSGMIALPMLLAKIGIVPSVALMLFLWFVIYHTSLINIELNLQAAEALPLGKLARKFSGKMAEFIGTVSFKILSYTLLAVYLSAGSSVLNKMLGFYGYHLSLDVVIVYTLCAAALLMLPLKILDYVNRLLFLSLLVVVAVMIIGLATAIQWHDLPLFANGWEQISNWLVIIPVVFTAFGFQVIFHTLTKFCEFNPKMLAKAFFWGSLIPAMVYILWTSSILTAISQNNSDFYTHLQQGDVQVGDLIDVLSKIAKWTFVQMLVWWLSLLAIITSVIGIGVGLESSIAKTIKVKQVLLKKIIAVIITLFPPYILATQIPNAFTKLLGFAGMILVIIAIILPIYLFIKAKFEKVNYKWLISRALLLVSFLSGFIIILCEFTKYF